MSAKSTLGEAEDNSQTHLSATAEELAALLGPYDSHRKLLEDLLEVRVTSRGGGVTLSGPPQNTQAAAELIDGLLQTIRSGRGLATSDIRYAVRQLKHKGQVPIADLLRTQTVVTHRGKPISPRTPGQAAYVAAVVSHDLTVCIGPAGTGKTYLAMAVAVAALRDSQVSRIVLTRPIVEAGESLGFLPGDMLEKVDPYLRPLQDALHDILGAEKFRKLLDRGTIEVIPLAYMRGRTLNDAFIVLDEAQNTTIGQMKMALTRLGFGSKMVVVGDITQTDLPAMQTSGLAHAVRVLSGLSGVAVCELTGEDIVRHDLVQRIVAAYEADPAGVRSEHEKSAT
ncbi:PhoH family protein [bacterium]|nr:PhoH family protein [bacterium]